jgi:MFS family permease
MLIVLVSHFNRVSIATAGDTRIMSHYSISPTKMGFVYSAFLFTYTAFMIPGGLLIDRVGPRAALMIVGFGSALFVCLTGAVGLCFGSTGQVFLGLVVVRSLMGIVSAPLHPSCARAVGNWVEPRCRSQKNGMINGAALLGIAATPPGFGALINFVGWPGAFLIMGGATVVVAFFWTVCASDGPDGNDNSANGDDQESFAGAWHELLRCRSLMLVTAAYGAVGYFQYMFFYWMSYYFETVLKLPPQQSHYYAAIPPLAMAVGMPLGGWISDRLEHVRGNPASRKIVPMAGMSLGAVFLVLGILAREPASIVTWFALALLGVGLVEGPHWSTATDLGGRQGGSAAGVLNFGGNAGGILAPILTPWVGQLLGWSYAVALGGLICLAGFLLWIWIDPQEKPATVTEL